MFATDLLAVYATISCDKKKTKKTPAPLNFMRSHIVRLYLIPHNFSV